MGFGGGGDVHQFDATFRQIKISREEMDLRVVQMLD